MAAIDGLTPVSRRSVERMVKTARQRGRAGKAAVFVDAKARDLRKVQHLLDDDPDVLTDLHPYRGKVRLVVTRRRPSHPNPPAWLAGDTASWWPDATDDRRD